tara:strand:+ start:779 stop:955 length:177 start_codon:yes stop_codon:yes gene_type:complete
MAGCYGNSLEDRYFERMLDDYLDQYDECEEEEEEEEDECLDPEDYYNKMNHLRRLGKI